MTDADLERLLVLDAAAGPALAIDAFTTNELIEAALVGAGFGAGGGGASQGGRARGGGGSGAAGMTVGTKLAILGGLVAVAIAIALLVGRPHHGQPQTAPPADAAIDAPPDAAIATGSAADATVETPAVEEPTIEMPADDVPRGKPHDTKTAADLLGEANAKRAEKKWKESDALYARVIERAPKTLAAQTALVASGSLHLEHLGDPKGATQRFKKALAIAPKGPLAEDARWGLAEAARANHDARGEAAALDDFIQRHPDSPLISQAKARRAELK